MIGGGGITTKVRFHPFPQPRHTVPATESRRDRPVADGRDAAMKKILVAMAGPLAAAVLAATPALAVDVKEQARIEAPIQKVWEQITEFCAIAGWHPAVATCDLRETEGKKPGRVITLKDGGVIEEQLLSVTASRRTVRYTLLSGPLPVANDTATTRSPPAPRPAPPSSGRPISTPRACRTNRRAPSSPASTPAAWKG